MAHILGKLRSTSLLALPDARNMFSGMQDALTDRRKGTVINLNKGVDQWIVWRRSASLHFYLISSVSLAAGAP